jgi:hypothetical protein
MNAIDLRHKLQGLSLRAAQLQGVLNSDREQQAATTKEVSLAKGRTGLSEEVGRVLDALQSRAHQRSVGAFENLLSAVLNDVLPGEGLVKLLADYKNNSTYLDFALEKNGGLEDVLDGNGGAVTNVICAGLRYAALSRTSNRRLMVLDEPDCWLKPDRVPFFVNVISQVSRDMRTQTFFITHHDTSYFEGNVNIVRFFADEAGKVHAQALAPLAQDWENDEQMGIRAIELINVRRHEHTLVPCYPGATAFIGDNNLGKSTAIVTALKAVAYGESDDSMIRHGCTEAKIVIYLENKQRLEWSRNTKRSPSVLFKLFKGEELVSEGKAKARNQAPEWVTDVLGVSRVDELDLQIGSQKSPVFLLNDTAPRRAQILSVGRESSHLRSYMKLYEELKAKDRSTAQAGELLLARLSAKLTYLLRIEPLVDSLKTHVENGEDLLRKLEEREALSKWDTRLTAMETSVSTLAEEAEVLSLIPVAPALQDTATLAALVERLAAGQRFEMVPALLPMPAHPALSEVASLFSVSERIAAGQKFENMPLVPGLPVAPELADLAVMLALGQRISSAEKSLAAAPAILTPIPTSPGLHDTTELGRLLATLAQREEANTKSKADATATLAELAIAEKELLDLQETLGGDCPLCGNAFSHRHTNQVETHVH